ncbi:MAG TPA: DUF3990 domain-containing protein [Candidatus Bacteroides merdigallinarum]|uniref:DUF3990 domain-containing protein n=1 Tax=Candidatus Bacteroides merdigallinarum TaxID=2838473 RepID=A0A9D2J172_9BACE|nr:DUF3990 domain-containing protein [Candidatus Bacteroides merdigallinarum]
MKLYHASPFIITQPDIYHSREHLDFGKGFYLTILREQACQYAQRFLLRGKTAYINHYVLDDELSEFNVKKFEQYDEEWLDYVSKCRKGIALTKYDIVEGGIANDRVFNTIDLYFAGLIAKEEALGRLAFEYPNHQLCILNQNVINRHLHFSDVEKITVVQKGK